MSYELTKQAIHAKTQRPTDKLVLIVLADHCNTVRGDRMCWPSYDTITELTGLRRETVAVAINRLEAAGLITVERGHGHKASRYTIASLSVRKTEPNSVRKTGLNSVRKNVPEQRKEQKLEQRRGRTSLPPGFVPDLDFALQKGLTLPESEIEAEKFKAHYEANGETRTSWPKAWQSWILRVPDFRGNGHGDGLSKRQRMTLHNIREAESLKRQWAKEQTSQVRIAT